MKENKYYSLLPGLSNCSFNEFLDFYLKATQLNCCVIDRLDTKFLNNAIFPVSLFYSQQIY